eukprot:8963238-Heterocapsa_arctica.AAC.1
MKQRKPSSAPLGVWRRRRMSDSSKLSHQAEGLTESPAPSTVEEALVDRRVEAANYMFETDPTAGQLWRTS